MSASPSVATLVPAQLGFLAIYNPSLGTTDETIDDQIVYYASVNTQSQRRRRRRKKKNQRSQGKPTENLSQDERNERLRQIGLAQGMVEFSRGFSGGKAVDTIETEKSRVILHELEPGWWILASIDLTRLPLPPRLGAPSTDADASENVEYSSKEIKPATLLLQDLLRAHSTFLLHHAASLSALFVRTKRLKFVNLLSRYWDLFLSTWNVMLHGNPATSVFAGIKIAACGELGIGVGEEERGSGEREVLEGFVERTEGLVDLVVSKFGPSDIELDADSPTKEEASEGDSATKWLGTGDEPGAEDGAIFLGVGALSRKSLRDVTYWMEDLYSWGEEAYGVKDNPSSTRQTRRIRKQQGASPKNPGSQSKDPTGESAAADPKQPDGKAPSSETPETGAPSSATPETTSDEGSMNRFMNYLKLGYGTHWSLGSNGGTEEAKQDDTTGGSNATKEAASAAVRKESIVPDSSTGGFLIGLVGGVEETDESSPVKDPEHPESGTDEDECNSRVLVRTLNVELDSNDRPEGEMSVDLTIREGEVKAATLASRKNSVADPDPRQDHNKTQKLRVIVYVNRPFIYTFLFESRTDCLAWDSFYRSLHYMLAPLRKPLGASSSYRPGRPDIGPAAANIFDLVWDPKTLTIHSTIPNIPDPLHIAHQHEELSSKRPEPLLHWSRAEAVNTHNQILNTYIATRGGSARGHSHHHHLELERTSKTNRGWWVVWTRILEKDSDPDTASGSGSANVSGNTTPRGPTGAIQPQEQPTSDNGGGGEADNEASTDGPSFPGAQPTPQDTPGEGEEGPSPGARSGSQPTTTTSNTTTDTSEQIGSTAGVDKEVFLIRRAGEHHRLRHQHRRATVSSGGGGGFGSLGGILGGGDSGVDAAAAAMGAGPDGAEGIGVDTKRYIEGLLSLAR